MKGLLPKEKLLYLPYSKRTVSVIYFDAAQVFASLLSCPLLNRNENFMRSDMEALRNHYSGKGNTSRRIAVAERIRDSLFYKNERSMKFSAFLDKMQKMLNIFEEENEQITEQAKVRLLLKKVEHPQLQDAVSALRIQSSMDGLTFTACANHLSAQVSELPDQQSDRKISGTGSNHGKASEPKRIRGGGPDNG